ncbi:MAG: SUMF1/EgtB/PvdO family nonheme iron enzyme [Bacteroidales bacterium]|nr:SUMF1/EgtB/PvdO family nonheme iron enzyme [Bacteroidales bacterium]
MSKQYLYEKMFGLLLFSGMATAVFHSCGDGHLGDIEPWADFTMSYRTADGQAAAPPCLVMFTNATNTGGLSTTYSWTVNGVQIATSQDISYTFTSSGTHTVALRAINRNGSHYVEKSLMIPQLETNVMVTGITIHPSEVSIEAGKIISLTATVTPDNATNKDVIWSSFNTDMAIVDDMGVVTGIRAGMATIFATAADGSGVSSSKIISITFPDFEMAFIEGGSFLMGGTNPNYFPDELPPHQVTLNSFYMAKYQVIQAQWIALMGNNPSFRPGPNLPVENVSWNDIVGLSGSYVELSGIRYYEDGFIYKLNVTTGKGYRLPTEAEWEYAARGGNKSMGYLFSGSDNPDEVAWYISNSNFTTYPWGLKRPNELGVYDMSGNVWEWCQDWYGAYPSTPQTNPRGPETGMYRVSRGGAQNSYLRYLRVSCRNYDFPYFRSVVVGFRLVCDSAPVLNDCPSL